MQEKKANIIISLLVFLVSLVVYTKTMAPTVSFWDSGEFISSSHILGVPHPPGTPFYVLVGRVFSMLPISSVIAVRVNFLSVFFSALANLFFYLIISHLIRRGSGFKPDITGNIPAFAGGIVGSLTIAFSYTYWNNAVEAEVYALASFFIGIVCWGALVWAENRSLPHDKNILLLMVYILGLSVGNHLTTLLTAPAIFAFIFLTEYNQTRYHWWMTALKLWLFASIFFAIGLSIHLYLPLRSSLDPGINEATPRTWTMFWEFINRKQYQQGSILERRASFAFQLRMFWDYFQWQYHYFSGNLANLARGVFLALGLWGLVENLLKDRKTFVMMILLLLVSTLGLIIYLNFTDHEVRDRDYFFTPAFIFWGVFVGMGAGYLLTLVDSLGQKPVTALCCCAVLLLPIIPLNSNVRYVSRENNYIAHDYAYNMLNSVDEGGIIFTNGDNDTFPLWFLQEVLGVKKDVVVANLSLLNTHWYIKQLKRPPLNVPIKLSDAQIDSLYPFRSQSGKVWFLKDMMVRHIINSNRWKRPIYFAVTVSQDNRKEFQDHLSLEGLVFRLVPEEGKSQINLERTAHNAYELYNYRGLEDPDIYKDENTKKLLTNYSAAFSYMAVKAQQAKDLEAAAKHLRNAARFSPSNMRLFEGLSSVYGELDEPDSVSHYFDRALDVARTETDSTDIFLHHCAVLYQMGQIEKASEVCEEAVEYFPNNPSLYGMMVDLYGRLKLYEKAVTTLKEYLDNINRNDPQALSLLKRYESLAKGEPLPGEKPETSPPGLDIQSIYQEQQQEKKNKPVKNETQ